MKTAHMSLVIRITLITLSALILSAASIGIFSYSLNRRNTIETNAEKALAISKTVASAIDPGQFVEIMSTKEKNDYWYTAKAFVDDVLERNGVAYLYVLDKNYGAEVTYFTEGISSTDSESEAIDLGETESIEYHADEMFETIRSGIAVQTAIYISEEYGSMVSGFAPILDKSGAVVGVVGVDLSIDDVMRSSNQFGLFIVIFIAALCIVIGFFITWYIKRIIGKPITDLAKAAEKISMGDIDVTVYSSRNDEIGVLVGAFNQMIGSTKKQAQVFEALANGDLTIDISQRCKDDVINKAIAKMNDNLNIMFSGINSATEQVSFGSKQIADGAQSLAASSSEQATAIQQLSASIADIAQKTKNNADMALRTEVLSNTIEDNAEKGSLQMDNMLRAVRDIGEASKSIGKVIKVIDDIAFQTNILALNAAVEAARAGQHGKGFAVVAEEVRNLASKSAEAAKDTDSLITNSIEKAELGVLIAGETAESLKEIVAGIRENSQIVGDIAKSSGEQTDAIIQINKSIDGIAGIVSQTSAMAEESAASSEEMSGQADILNGLVSQFKLK